MWTEEQRLIYRREGDGYPSDLRDAEWAAGANDPAGAGREASSSAAVLDSQSVKSSGKGR